MSYILCLNKADWPAFTEEVKVALGADGERPIWLGHFEPDGTWVPVCTVEGVDGSCWTAHPLSAEKVLEANTYDNPAVQVLDELPEGWKAVVVEE